MDAGQRALAWLRECARELDEARKGSLMVQMFMRNNADARRHVQELASILEQAELERREREKVGPHGTR